MGAVEERRKEPELGRKCETWERGCRGGEGRTPLRGMEIWSSSEGFSVLAL